MTLSSRPSVDSHPEKLRNSSTQRRHTRRHHALMEQHAPWRAKSLGACFLEISGKSLSDHDTVVTEDVRARCSAASALRSLTQNSAGSLVLYPGNNYLDRVLE